LTPIQLYAQEILFPGLSGLDLLNAVQDAYTPNLNLSYAEARDTLYSRIDVRNDTIHGIYTDYGVYLQPNTDPTTTLFAGGINTEHIYPQGKGATEGTPPYFNMHHLAPSLANVNSDRANLPFSDISDNVTDKWYYLDQQMTSIPSANIDQYTESTGNYFEPRESVKGNVARAMFYIHAIYRDQVMAVDPVFFLEQQADLCHWHFSDPVDETELLRTEQIAGYQDNKENPFVLDCTLAERMYCGGLGDCLVPIKNVSSEAHQFEIRNDAQSDQVLLINVSDQTLSFQMSIYRIDGRLLLNRNVDGFSEQEKLELGSYIQDGAFIMRIKTSNGYLFNQMIIGH
jgi:hypothetical protein